MRWSERTRWFGGLIAVGGALLSSGAGAQVLTVDQAVQLALQRSTTMVNAQADVVNARSGVYSAASGVLPSLTADWSRSGEQTTGGSGIRPLVPPVQGIYFSSTQGSETYSTTPSLSANWPILDLANLRGLGAARTGLRAAEYRRSATRAQVALDTRTQFYAVVRAEHLSVVANEAVRLARDDERRVRALFEVGSVARSDLLKAQVATAQAQLDSITRELDITNQRVGLARQLGLREADMASVDTVLTASPRSYDEGQLLEEARHNRPDLQAAEAGLRAARGSVSAANLARLPFVNLSASGAWNPRTNSTQTFVLYDSTRSAVRTLDISSASGLDRDVRGTVALTWNVFNGFRTESQIAAAKARLLVAQDTRDQLARNLQAEVHAALLGYREAVAALEVAERGLASAEENVRLTQQKYNVGSATILELIDAQVALQQARSNRVSALAGIRLAEATLDRVRGRTE